MSRRLPLRPIVVRVLLAAMVLAAAQATLVAPASAQLFENPPLLLRLFGVKKKEDRSALPPAGARVIRVPRDGDNRVGPGSMDPRGGLPALGPTGPVMPKIIKAPDPALLIKPKNDDAKVVVVLGDDFATSLASGLNVAFADTPTIRIEPMTVERSGLADPTVANWPERLADRLAEAKKPDAVVVMLGAADRVPIPVDGVEREFRSERWEVVYRARVQAMIAEAKTANVPLYWVGLVPMADLDRTTDMAYLDEIVRQEVGKQFAVYVDVWNAFADATGSFSASGADVEGQVRKLRLSNGEGFTKSGSRKLAFFVEQELRKWLERGAPSIVLPSSANGLVVSLADPEAEPGEDLAPVAAAALPKEGTPLHTLVVKGQPLTPVVGRVDDLRIRR